MEPVTVESAHPELEGEEENEEQAAVPGVREPDYRLCGKWRRESLISRFNSQVPSFQGKLVADNQSAVPAAMSTPGRPGPDDVSTPAPPVGLSPQESSTTAAQALRVRGGSGEAHLEPGHVSPFTLDPSAVSSPVTPLSDYHRPSPAQSATIPPQASRVLFTPGQEQGSAAQSAKGNQQKAVQGSPTQQSLDYSPTHFSTTFESSSRERTETESVNFSGGAKSDAGTGQLDVAKGGSQVLSPEFSFTGKMTTPQVQGMSDKECPPAPAKQLPQ